MNEQSKSLKKAKEIMFCNFMSAAVLLLGIAFLSGAIFIAHGEGHTLKWYVATLFVVLSVLALEMIFIFKPLKKRLEKMQESAMQADIAKSEFLTSMSHEIRTPLNGILGMAGLLYRSDMPEKYREQVRTIMTSGESLLDIVNDVLDYSKIEAGKLSVHEAVFDLRKLCHDVVQAYSARAQEKAVELVVSISSDLPSMWIGDAALIRQVLMNLVGNATKFTEQGRIIVRVNRTESSGLKIEVEDSGVGIPRNKIKHIFDKFSQADSSASRRFGGTGLGLAICKRIVESMNGEIGVESVPDEGSTFWFDLPLTEVEHQNTPDANLLKGKRIMLVDDFEESLQAICQTLEVRGAECVAFSDPRKALLRLNNCKPDYYDCVVVDYSMPDIDGEEFAMLLKKNDAMRHVPLVAMVLWGNDEICSQLEVAGYSMVLQKNTRPGLRAKQIASLMDGTLCFNSREDKEDNVDTLYLGTRVLVVEDNLVNRTIAEEMLKELGCEVAVADNGLYAVDYMKEHMDDPVDVVMMDCLMPQMDGYQATDKIRLLERTLRRRTPIIALTANAMEGDREKCLQAGMDDYIAKPFNQKNLVEVLDRWVEKKDAFSVVTKIA